MICAIALNPGVTVGPSGMLMYKGRPLGGSKKIQLQLALSCMKHFKQCNFSSITKEADLLCPFTCCTPSEVLESNKKAVPGPNEQVFALRLEGAAMLKDFRFQPKVLQGWKGGVDFYCPSTRLVVQIDDPHHFREHHIHGESRGVILENDMQVNVKCWEQGFPLLRLTKEDLEDAALTLGMVESVQLHLLQQGGKDARMQLVVLSRFYSNVKMGELDCYGDGQADYLAACEERLHASRVVRADLYDSVWFQLTK